MIRVLQLTTYDEDEWDSDNLVSFFCYAVKIEKLSVIYASICRGLLSRMLFPGNQIFPVFSGKSSVLSIRELPLPGPDLVPAFGTGHFPVLF